MDYEAAVERKLEEKRMEEESKQREQEAREGLSKGEDR